MEKGPSVLPFAYSLYGILFIIYSQMATDILENFHIFLFKTLFFFLIQNLDSQNYLSYPTTTVGKRTIWTTIAHSLCGVLFLICSTDPLENFHVNFLHTISLYMGLYCILYYEILRSPLHIVRYSLS